jgi:ABC-type branched-subunit amino acid transport system ATPase component
MLAFENVEVVYDDVLLALRGVSLEVPDGAIVVAVAAGELDGVASIAATLEAATAPRR